MIDEYLDKLSSICASPRYQEILVEEECSLLRAGKINSQDWKKILRTPKVQAYLNSHPMDAPLVYCRKIQTSLNHPAHQAIIWMSDKILENATIAQKQRYKRILTSYGWINIPKNPLSDSAIMFFFNDPNYATLYQCARMILQNSEMN